jgi:signal peptidase I
LTPLELLALVATFSLVRIGISMRPGITAPAARTRLVIREYLDAFIVAGLVALVLVTFLIRPFFIPSESMVPTLKIHDVLMANEFEYRIGSPKSGDIAIFVPPIPSTDDFIKRTIGVPGDTVRIHRGIVYRNGVALAEPYVAEKPNYELEIKDYHIVVDGIALDPASANFPARAVWSAPDRIPDGCYLMLGDNRNRSDDSHLWGFAQTGGTFHSGPREGQRASFTGHAFVRFWPLDRAALLGR